METHVGFDWLRYTAPQGTNAATILPEGVTKGESIEPLPYYNLAYQLLPSGRLDLNTKNAKQGQMVTFTGGDLRLLEESLGNLEEIASQISGKNLCKPTRIDIAVDVIDGGASPESLYNAYIAGKAKTRAREARRITGFCREIGRVGDTFYLGASRSAEMYMRVYCKSLEALKKSGLIRAKNTQEELALIDTLKNLDYTRVEIEMKGEKAKMALNSVVEQGIGKTAKASIARYVDFPSVTWWGNMMSGLPDANLELMTGENHNKDKTDRWLLTQALPAVVRAIRDGNWHVISATEKALGEISKNLLIE